MIKEGLHGLIACVPPAGMVYHLAEPGALSEAVRPLKPDGSVDAEVLARLSVRHDDSMQNVANRLALWDRQVGQQKKQPESVKSRRCPIDRPRIAWGGGLHDNPETSACG